MKIAKDLLTGYSLSICISCEDPLVNAIRIIPYLYAASVGLPSLYADDDKKEVDRISIQLW